MHSLSWFARNTRWSSILFSLLLSCAMCSILVWLQISSFGCLFEHVFTDVLDWILWSILSQLLQCFNQLRHDVSIEVLSDWEVGICLFIFSSVHIVHLPILIVIHVYRKPSKLRLSEWSSSWPHLKSVTSHEAYPCIKTLVTDFKRCLQDSCMSSIHFEWDMKGAIRFNQDPCSLSVSLT